MRMQGNPFVVVLICLKEINFTFHACINCAFENVHFSAHPEQVLVIRFYEYICPDDVGSLKSLSPTDIAYGIIPRNK